MRAWALAGLVLLSACGSGNSAATTTTETPATTAPPLTTTTLAPGAVWTPCGAIRCGVLAGSKVKVYSRAATTGDGLGTLVMIPDFEGPTARELVEQATVMVGPVARSLDVVSLSPRGGPDSMPLPCNITDDPVATAQSCRSNQALQPENMGTIAAVADLQELVRAMNLGPVRVVGWGRGATIAAAWAMLHPESIEQAVLDSPDDPEISPVTVAEANRINEDAALANVMAWCTEHISCAFVENAAKRVKLVLSRIRDQREGAVAAKATETTFRLAFRNVIRSGNYGAIFQVLAAAENNDYAPLVELAGTPPWAARIAAECADVSAADAEAIIAADAAFTPTPTLFRVGYGASIMQVCTGMPESPNPLGQVAAVKSDNPPDVQVFVGTGDGETSPSMVRGLAKRMKWKFHSVPANRHLVVGFDRTTTQWVSDYLGS